MAHCMGIARYIALLYARQNEAAMEVAEGLLTTHGDYSFF